MGDKLGNSPSKVELAERTQAIETFLIDRTDEVFCMRVRVRSAIRRATWRMNASSGCGVDLCLPLIRDMSTANPLWGAPRIHGELLKLRISVSQSTVATYMRRRPRTPSQTWRTRVKNHASQIMAADLFVVPTIGFRLLFVLVILAHDRRRIVHVAVTEHPTAAWTA